MTAIFYGEYQRCQNIMLVCISTHKLLTHTHTSALTHLECQGAVLDQASVSVQLGSRCTHAAAEYLCVWDILLCYGSVSFWGNSSGEVSRGGSPVFDVHADISTKRAQYQEYAYSYWISIWWIGTFVVYVVIYHIGHAFMWSFATLLLAVYVVIYHISGRDPYAPLMWEITTKTHDQCRMW